MRTNVFFVNIMNHIILCTSWQVPLLGPWLGDKFWKIKKANETMMFRDPLPATIQRAKEGEFPWATLLVFSSGPSLTGALVTRNWIVSSMPPGILSYSKAMGTDSLGRAYFGIVHAEKFAGEGKWNEGMKCPGWDKDIYCGLMAEVVPQDTTGDPIRSFVLVKISTEIAVPVKKINRGIMANSIELPYNHREQCMAVWFAPTKESTFRRRRSLRTKRGLKKDWNLWSMPLGLWHVGHCRKDSRKSRLACEDTIKDEEAFRSMKKGGLSKIPGLHAGGPSDCSPQYRRSAVAECQGKIFAFRLHAVGGYEIFQIKPKMNKDTVLCSPISDALRRLWLMLGPDIDWIYYQVVNRRKGAGGGLKATYMVPEVEPLKLPRPMVEDISRAQVVAPTSILGLIVVTLTVRRVLQQLCFAASNEMKVLSHVH